EAFVGAAIPEETVKLLMLWLMLRKCDEYDEAIDGIVYAVCIGMGFAGFENVLYVFQSEEEWGTIALLRSLLAVPGHYMFAVLMGFFYSLVHFHPRRYGKYKFLIWLAPVLAHGIYDAILMVGAEHELLSLLSYIPLIAFCVWMHRFCYKRLGHAERLDVDTADLATFCAAVRQEKFLRERGGY
ncbi:MAG: PrsW family intramembrane metalloprotease, partial [Bacteroidales bacterium]|nr:PrsW family intramembrane metalloprotease [Bacteroidales bacterium]